ncbi:MAG TPA: NAD(P)-dependent oxidoreductase [Acidiferrobacteraceae bacterium]|nr:NAD(P)-dependent oxidoreductase [Acidiferrobacteraceae bacterium]
MKPTVLVTGANGFVGSHALDALLQTDSAHVLAACRNRRKLSPMFTGTVRAGDLRDAAYRAEVVAGVDVVCHAAAWTSLWGHAAASRRLYLEPTLALIEAARAAGVRRFINISTTSAAAPHASRDAMSRGIPRSFWPHLCNLIAIEDALRAAASPGFSVINLRVGIFAGARYGLGLLPILVPRLRTHLVPWIAGGRTQLPLVDGRDIGQAFARAALASGLAAYSCFNIVGPEIPSVRDVLLFLRTEYGLPNPHFSVPFALAYPFGWLMEHLDPVVPWEPLVTRSIIHLLENVDVDNDRAEKALGYRPQHSWQEAVRLQMAAMGSPGAPRISMSKALE